MIFSGRKTEYPKRKSDSGVNFYMNKKEIAEKVRSEIKKSYLQFINFNKARTIEKLAATGIFFSPKLVYILGSAGYSVFGKFFKQE